MTGIDTPLHMRAAEADAVIAQILSPAGEENPYPFYARLLELGTVHLTADGMCYIAGHAACEMALRRPEFGLANRFDVVRPDWQDHLAFTLGQPGGMAMTEPPAHTRLRRPVSGAFTARRVQTMREDIARLVDGLLDALAEQGAGGGPVDFMEVFAYPLPVSVISAMLGLPVEDFAPINPLVRTWLAGVGPAVTVSAAQLQAADAAAEECRVLLSDAVAEQRQRPAGGLLTVLIEAADGPDGLSEEEIVSLLFNIYLAGFLTTAHLLGNSLVAFESAPDQADLLSTSPELAASAVDELLRYDAPVQLLGRMVLQAVTVDGVHLPAGTPAMILPGAGNRDPRVFDDPDLLNLRRQPNPHVSFGGGIHYCLGAILAKLEAQLALPALLQRFPDLYVGAPRRRTQGLSFRGYDSLPIHVESR